MTSSPGPIPIASSAITSASVPFATPMLRGTPRYPAASLSKALTFGPRMKIPESRTSATRSWICGIRRSYCAFTSTRGMLGTRAESRCSPSEQQVHRQENGSCHDDDVDVVKRVVELLVAGAHAPPDARQREAPDGRPRDRQQRVPAKGHAEDPGRDRDERADDRRDSPDEDGPVVPAVEPALGAVQPLGPEVEESAVPLGQRPAAVPADRP